MQLCVIPNTCTMYMYVHGIICCLTLLTKIPNLQKNCGICMYMYMRVMMNVPCQVVDISLNEQDLPHLQVLDLSHNKVNSLSALHFRIGNVAKISLSSNEIKSLNGMCTMHIL